MLIGSEEVTLVAKEDLIDNLGHHSSIADGWLEIRSAFVMGRDKNCDLQIDGPGVEGCHAEIYKTGTVWWVRDLGTDEGTYLNGEIIDASPLEFPSELRLGIAGPTLRLDTRTDPLFAADRIQVSIR